MFYYLSDYQLFFGPLRVFQYVTFRSVGALFTAMLLTLLLGPLTIRLLHRFKIYSPGRLKGLVPDGELTPEKDDTPIMGGLLIIFSITFSSILWGILRNPLTLLFLATLISLGGLGFLDDYIKVKHVNSKGISGKLKLLIQFVIASSAITTLFAIPVSSDYMYKFMIPFLKEPVLTGIIGAVFTVIIGMFCLIGASNAVNLTDGKDGLAVGCTIFCVLVYAVFAYLTGHKIFAQYLAIPYIAGAGEVCIFAAAIAGASIGFLWFNCNPASMFMGDTGSLALGGSMALIAILVRQELLLMLAGGVFVIEAGSVLIQVASFKLTGKRIFLITPIHHHFKKKGWQETQIVVRFWILAGIFSLAALATLKLR